MYAKIIFPKSFISPIFFRLTRIKLELEEEPKNGIVLVCKYKYGAKGAFCLSIDYDLPASKQIETDWRAATNEVLNLAEKHSIPMSWALCGNLVLKEKKVYERIKNSPTLIDLGIHTFTHTDYSHPSCTIELAREEILKSIKMLEEIEKPVTFIFPWNRIAHLHLLEEYGFITFRGNNIGKIAYPNKVQQLWDIHGSYYLVERSALEVKVILKLIDFAISYNGLFHIWSHPWDLHIDGDPKRFGKKVLDPVFSYAAEKRKDGLLWICNMRELANYCEARESCKIRSLIELNDQINFSISCQINDPRFDYPPTITLEIFFPKDWKDLRILVDSKEKKSNFTYKSNWKRSKLLYLTLSFLKPDYHISIIRKK